MHTTDRKPRMLSNEVVATGADETARNAVFTLGAPRAIVIKVNSKDTLGLPAATTTKEELQRKLESHREVAAKFGIDGDAYRDRQGLTHNGVHVYENAARIRLIQLVADLLADGYILANASWFQKPAMPGRRQPDPTVHLAFSLDGEGIEMTARVMTFLIEVYIDGFHLWCNPKMSKDGTPYRLDTINGFAGERPMDMAAKPGYRLRYTAPEQGSSGYTIVE